MNSTIHDNPLWNLVQNVLGCPDFKSKLYRSVLRPPGRLLDFGCANGHIADAFPEFDYNGIDIDPVAVDAARERFKAHPNAKFIAADIHSRPYDQNYFDEILFAGTAHHLTDKLFVSNPERVALLPEAGENNSPTRSGIAGKGRVAGQVRSPFRSRPLHAHPN